MTTTVDVIGIYPVEGEPTVRLMELLVRNSPGPFNMGEFTQESPGLPVSNWQVAYDEQLLDEAGTTVLADGFSARRNPALWTGNVRLIFFFHHLEPSKPLLTPFGRVVIPAETPKPKRLSGVVYEAP